jgi:hypothetical protein
MASSNIRYQLHRDHEMAFEELKALRGETGEERTFERLGRLRRSWMIHALGVETVVYKALEAAVIAAGGKTSVDVRFAGHGLVEGLFDKLMHGHPGTVEWHARLNVLQEFIASHIATEHDDMLVRLSQRFDRAALREMGHRFDLTRGKLTFLEEAKAA